MFRGFCDHLFQELLRDRLPLDPGRTLCQTDDSLGRSRGPESTAEFGTHGAYAVPSAGRLSCWTTIVPETVLVTGSERPRYWIAQISPDVEEVPRCAKHFT